MGYDIVCYGEIVIDDYGRRKVLAGAPLNAASVAATLGMRTAIVSAVNENDLEKISNLVITRNITPILQSNELPTGKAKVKLDPNGVPSFALESESAFDKIRERELGNIDTEFLLFGSLGLRGMISRRTINNWLERKNIDGFFDMNLRSGFADQTAFAEAIKKVRYVKSNESEQEIYEKLDRRYNFKDKTVFVTLGEMGAQVIGKNPLYSGAPEVVAKDTTGCGDTFCACIIYGLLNEWNMETTLDFAVKVSSAQARFHGAFSQGFSQWLAETVKRMKLTRKDCGI